jgi:hypothetical protein
MMTYDVASSLWCQVEAATCSLPASNIRHSDIPSTLNDNTDAKDQRQILELNRQSNIIKQRKQ